MKTLLLCFDFLTTCNGILAILPFLSFVNVKLSLTHFLCLADFFGYSEKYVETAFNNLKCILPNPPLVKGGSRFVFNWNRSLSRLLDTTPPLLKGGWEG